MDAIAYQDGYKYQLVLPYTIQTTLRPVTPIQTQWIALDTAGCLTIAAGYAWDGASGPTRDTSDSMRGSLVHDALYQLIGMQLLSVMHRKYADDLFERILEEDKMPGIRNNLWHWAVRTFGPRNGSRPKVVKWAPCKPPDV